MAVAEIEYLERRASSEAQMAQRAKSAAAVRAHYELSKAYFDQVEALRRQKHVTE